MRKFDELVEHFAKIELDPSSHSLTKEDFNTESDFYLEAVNHDSFYQYLKESLTTEELEAYDINKLWDAIKEYIEDAVVSHS